MLHVNCEFCFCFLKPVNSKVTVLLPYWILHLPLPRNFKTHKMLTRKFKAFCIFVEGYGTQMFREMNSIYSWEKRGISATIDKLHVLSIIININDGYIDISTYYLKAGQSNTSTRTIVYIREYKCLLQFLMRQLGTERNDVKKSLLLEVLIWIFPSKKI